MKSLSTLFLAFFAASAHAATEECANVDAKEIVTSISVATVRDAKGQDSLEDLVASNKLVEQALAFEGNLGYEFVKNAEDPNEYRFIEKWESMEALSKWMEGVHSELFSGQIMKGVLLGGELHDVQKYITPAPVSCRPYNTGTINYKVTSECKVVMYDAGRWDNGNYIPGVTKAEIKPNPYGSDKDYRWLYWGNSTEPGAGSIRHYVYPDEFLQHYEITEHPHNPKFAGYKGYLNMTQESDGCDIVYQFSNPKSDVHYTHLEIYYGFYSRDVPHQQNLYSKRHYPSEAPAVESSSFFTSFMSKVCKSFL